MGRAVLLRSAKFAAIDNPVPQLNIGPLQIIVDDNLIMSTGLLSVLQLILSLG
jgi:hypothetical protein